MSLSPKLKRNISRILPFGFIWLVVAWIFLLNDATLIVSDENVPETAVRLSAPVILFASVAVFILGLIVGTMEMVVFEKRFSNYSFIRKFFIKLLIYDTIILVMILFTYPIAEGISSGLSPIHPDVLTKLGRFLVSISFVNTSIQLAFQLVLSLIYAAISENLGHNVLKNFLTGKYHRPVEEKRIFMFLDMKQSTTIAETLGHQTYFDFLRRYYSTMSDAIIDNYGEVYQYVGDEIVITWDAEEGLKDQHCLKCFFDLKQALKDAEEEFMNDFRVAPDFRAGIHMGEVSIGEIGALKKEIVYSGDVLNTAARMQALGKEYGVDLIVSENVVSKIQNWDMFWFKHLGDILLRGKTVPADIYTLSLNPEPQAAIAN